ncbi:MAG: transcriptional regulator [Bacteroidetes bacterium]|nr:transcriptional regulator [Bacteroidota bacterium]
MESAAGYSTPLAIPFSELHNIVPIPDNRPFPASLEIIGNHIKKARLERGILIKDVITFIGIDRETLRNWERDATDPHVKYYPAIERFLGYAPWNSKAETLSEKIKMYRYRNGLTLEQFGNLLGVRECMVWEWESNNRMPYKKTKDRILSLLDAR